MNGKTIKITSLENVPLNAKDEVFITHLLVTDDFRMVVLSVVIQFPSISFIIASIGDFFYINVYNYGI